MQIASSYSVYRSPLLDWGLPQHRMPWRTVSVLTIFTEIQNHHAWQITVLDRKKENKNNSLFMAQQKTTNHITQYTYKLNNNDKICVSYSSHNRVFTCQHLLGRLSIPALVFRWYWCSTTQVDAVVHHLP